MVIVDISPVNQKFDVTSSTEWNMEHYFHCLKNVTFDQSMKISEVNKTNKFNFFCPEVFIWIQIELIKISNFFILICILNSYAEPQHPEIRSGSMDLPFWESG